jgi:hypothetical protein
MIHHEIAPATENLVGNRKGSADGEARIAGRWLNEDALERRTVEYFSVGQAIKCHATGKAD